MIKLIPSVLTNSPSELKNMINQAEGNTERVQIDIVDGQFAENKTIDPEALFYIDTNLMLDFHLMTKEPINWVEKCIRGGAERIIGQIEMMEDQLKFIEKVIDVGCLPGLAVDINTDIAQLDPLVLGDCDVVLIMSVPAGFQEQEFEKKSLAKVEAIVEKRKEMNLDYNICIDGGVGLGVVKDTVNAGCDEIVVGSGLFKGDFLENMGNYHNKLFL